MQSMLKELNGQLETAMNAPIASFDSSMGMHESVESDAAATEAYDGSRSPPCPADRYYDRTRHDIQPVMKPTSRCPSLLSTRYNTM